LPSLKDKLSDYDAFLVCCYSQHPLVSALRHEIAERNLNTNHGNTSKAVTGIFEASVATCLQSINPDEKFGIVSTGSQWEDILREAVEELLGTTSSKRYAGTATTGLNADELHTTPKEEVDRRMKEATKSLLNQGNVQAICLGCAGMAGMDETVREALVEALGEEKGKKVKIVDGVISGVIHLMGALRSRL
jgi:Asp/Glu/hydantoin racemase